MASSTLFLIHAKTHLHVGSGDSNYGVIDKLVQRDPTDNLPCIYASSLKGAFREYIEKALNNETAAELIFGASSGNKNKGTHVFHDAQILSIPQRSNVQLYFQATCPSVLKKLIDANSLYDHLISKTLVEQINSLNVPDKKIKIFQTKVAGIKIEDFNDADILVDSTTNISEIKQLLGDNIALLNDKDFMAACDNYSLPVIARNHLENGQSNNLWYEQIIPRESKFFFVANSYETETNGAQFKGLIGEQAKVQIGANASVGYGQCFIKAI